MLVDQGRFDEIGGVVQLYSVAGIGSQFFVDVEPNFTGVNVSARGKYSAEELRDIVTDVEKRVLAVGDIESIYTRTGLGGLSVGSGGTIPDRIGSMFSQMTDRRERALNGHEMEQAYEEAIQNIPGVRAEMRPQQMGPPVGKEIQIQLSGPDLGTLAQ